jgi:hypothetical protein
MAEGDMKEIASLIARAVRDADGTAAGELRGRVEALTSAHPAYPAPPVAAEPDSSAATPPSSAGEPR